MYQLHSCLSGAASSVPAVADPFPHAAARAVVAAHAVACYASASRACAGANALAYATTVLATHTDADHHTRAEHAESLKLSHVPTELCALEHAESLKLSHVPTELCALGRAVAAAAVAAAADAWRGSSATRRDANRGSTGVSTRTSFVED